MKVVYNACYGGFSLSAKAVAWLIEHECRAARKHLDDYERSLVEHPDHPRFKGWEGVWHRPEAEGLPRHHPLLVQCVEELAEEAGGPCARLEIAEISGRCYRIDEYDGRESVETPNSYEWVSAGEDVP